MFFFGGFPGETFPAGGNPWSSQLVAVNPNYSIFTPGQAPAAEEMNYLFGALSTAAGAGVTVPGAHWRVNLDVVTVTGEASYTGGKWDPISNRWLIALNSSNTTTPGTSYVVASRGCGDADFLQGSADSNPGGASQVIPPSPSVNIWTTDMVNDGTNYFAVGVGNASTTYIYRTNGSGWANVFSAADNTIDVRCTTFQGQICVVEITTLAINMYYSAVGDGASGHWNSFSPGLLQAGNGINIAQNATTLIAFPSKLSGGTTQYGVSTDGQHIVGHSSTGFMTASGESAWGVCWSPADRLFFLMTADVSFNNRFYSSPDGTTWTQVSGPFAAFGAPMTGLAATDDGCLCAIVVDTNNDCFPVFSIDQGVTWHFAQTRLKAPGFTPNFMFPKVVGSPTGFMAMNDQAMRFSGNSGAHGFLLT